ncbi:MAG: hypothetical protein RR319_03220 [Bacteroides sp.]
MKTKLLTSVCALVLIFAMASCCNKKSSCGQACATDSTTCVATDSTKSCAAEVCDSAKSCSKADACKK